MSPMALGAAAADATQAASASAMRPRRTNARRSKDADTVEFTVSAPPMCGASLVKVPQVPRFHSKRTGTKQSDAGPEYCKSADLASMADRASIQAAGAGCRHQGCRRE